MIKLRSRFSVSFKVRGQDCGEWARFSVKVSVSVTVSVGDSLLLVPLV